MKTNRDHVLIKKKEIFCLYECCWQNNSTENIEEDFEDRMKTELNDPENVDDAAIHDTEKACVEICVNAEKTV